MLPNLTLGIDLSDTASYYRAFGAQGQSWLAVG